MNLFEASDHEISLQENHSSAKSELVIYVTGELKSILWVVRHSQCSLHKIEDKIHRSMIKYSSGQHL